MRAKWRAWHNFVYNIFFDCDLVSVNNRQFINPKIFIQKFSKKICFS